MNIFLIVLLSITALILTLRIIGQIRNDKFYTELRIKTTKLRDWFLVLACLFGIYFFMVGAQDEPKRF